jgi:hypothetical protein
MVVSVLYSATGGFCLRTATARVGPVRPVAHATTVHRIVATLIGHPRAAAIGIQNIVAHPL